MANRIDSATNGKIKLAASLRQRKYREKEGLFLAEGVRLSEMAADSGWDISFGLYTERAAEEERTRALLAGLEGKGCRIYEVPEAVFAKASATDTPQGILLVIGQRKLPLEQLALPDNPMLMVMDGIQDPGNAGTMVRLADAAGMDGVILLKGCVDVFSDKVVRATMGSLFHLPMCADVGRDELVKFARQRGIRLYAAVLDEGAVTCYEVDFSEKIAMVFGNETHGVSEEILGEALKVYIPMFGRAESLNVATASAVTVYEAVRQRRYGKLLRPSGGDGG